MLKGDQTMSGGKRGAPAPLSNSSDEDEVDTGSSAEGRGLPVSPQVPTCEEPGLPVPALVPLNPLSDEESNSPTPGPHVEHDYAAVHASAGAPLSPTSTDHDYEDVSSPGSSSTASGPIYVRQPGFTHHAHEFVISRPKVKRKKTHANLLAVKEGLKKRDPTPPKTKPKREPLPMRLRALPQSFWQQPNKPQNATPGAAFPILPPLCTKDTEEDIQEVRPITPPEEPEETKEKMMIEKKEKEARKKQPAPERKVTVTNTDLLFKLFEGIEKEKAKNPVLVSNNPHFKRGRPRKMVPSSNKSFVSGQDPYMVDCVSEKLFPQLSLEQSKAHASIGGNATLELVTLRQGDKSVTLPALSVEQNYSQMLSELVMHI